MQDATKAKAKQKQNQTINGQLTDDLLRMKQYGNELYIQQNINNQSNETTSINVTKIFSALDPSQL